VSASRYRPLSDFDEVKLITSANRTDKKGFFSRANLHELGLRDTDFWSISSSVNLRSGTFRGVQLHIVPHEPLKVVGVSNGKLLDVIVILRRRASTFMQWSSIALEAGG
jgi:dTDP-4-dehydrorhamnose 3,5-epimerase-like enzyme